MSYMISKTFTFAAAHTLSYLPEGHKCARLHGHNYTVTLTLEAVDLDDYSFVVDYGALSDVKWYLEQNLDHRNLNDLLARPTAELLASWLFVVFAAWHPELVEVTVCETPSSSASYRP